jgi:hypothetical protein
MLKTRSNPRPKIIRMEKFSVLAAPKVFGSLEDVQKRIQIEQWITYSICSKYQPNPIPTTHILISESSLQGTAPGHKAPHPTLSNLA